MPSRIAFVATFTPPVVLGGYVMAYPALRWFGPDKGFSLDVSQPACFSRQADPQSGDVLVNFSNGATTQDGAMLVSGGNNIDFTGGGFYFGACTRNDNYVSINNAFDAIEAAANTVTASTTSGSPTLTVTAADDGSIKVGDHVTGTNIPAATTITAIPVGGGVGAYTMSANATGDGTGITVTAKSKEWVAIYWLKFPPSAAWPTVNGNATGLSAAGDYTSAVDLVTLYYVLSGTNKNFVVRVSKGINSNVALSFTDLAATFAGKIAQIKVEYYEGFARARIKAFDGSVPTLTASAALTAHTSSLTGKTWRFGLLSSGQVISFTSNPLAARDSVAAQTTFYSATFQSLKGCPKTPDQIADENFTWAQTYAGYA